MLHYSKIMKEINLITVGLQIRQIRKDKNLSLQEIANRTGLSKSLLSKVENFRTIPSLPVLLRISNALNVDMAPDGTVYGIELLNANEQLQAEADGHLVSVFKTGNPSGGEALAVHEENVEYKTR